MRQAYPGQIGYGQYNTPLMAAAAAGAPEGDRLANLKRAIESIEHKLSGAQGVMPTQMPAQFPPVGQALPYQVAGQPAAMGSFPNGSELNMMQEQLNRLSSHIAPPQSFPIQPSPAAYSQPITNPVDIAAQVAQRQMMLNGVSPQPIAAPVAAPISATVPKAAPPAAPLPPQTAVNNGMEMIGQHLNGLKKELSELKKQVSKPVAVQQSVSQKEIDRIAKAIADLQKDSELDEQAFNNLAKELDGMREGMRKDISQAVRREIATSNGNQANEMSTRFDARLDALTKELDSFSHKSVSDFGTRLDGLSESINAASLHSVNTVTPQVDNLANQMDALRMTVDDLPQTLAISRLEERLSDVASKLDGLSTEMGQATPHEQAVSSEDISSIEGRLDEIARALVAVSNSTSAAPAESAPVIDMSGVDRVEARMSDLARVLDELSTKDSSSDLQNIAVRIDGLTERLGSFEKYAKSGDLGGANAMFASPDIGMVEEQLRQLNEHIESAAAQSQTGQLEEQLRQLAARVEEAANVNSTAAQMSNLEAQIGQIIRHMSKEEAAVAIDFSPLEVRLGSIETQLVSNQNFSLEAAQQAAQQAVALMGDQSEPAQIINALSQDLKSLQMTAESGNAQNAQTVESVQQTLHQVVERLMSIETSINDTTLTRAGQMVEEQPAPSFSAGFAARTEAVSAPATDDEQLGLIHQAAVEAGFATTEAPVMEVAEPIQVDAPPLSPADHIENAQEPTSPEDNALLEPGSVAPDLSRMVQEASEQLSETKATLSEGVLESNPIAPTIDKPDTLRDVRPSDDLRPDAVAAARRALQATTAEMNAVKDEVANIQSENGKGLAGKINGLKSGFDLSKLRKPLMMGAAALLLAVVAFKGVSMFKGGDIKPIAKIETSGDVSKNKSAISETKAIENSDGKIVRNIGDVKTTDVDSAETPEAKIEVAKAVTQEPDAKPIEAAKPVGQTDADETVKEDAKTSDTNQPSAEDKTVEQASTAQPKADQIDVPASAGSPALVAAAAEGDPKALFQIGMRYSDGNGVKRNMTESAKWFNMAADKGFAPAQYSIGSLFEKGIGVERNIAKASSWYEKAALQGNARAMHNLAVIYAMGNPPAVQPNMDKAVGWFQKAAKLGIKDSQFNLGILYGQGMGVPQNLGDSYLWFALAAKTGDSDAATKRDEVANAMDPSALDDARKSVNDWTPAKLTEAVNRVAVPKEWQGKSTATPKTSASNTQTNVKAAQSLLNQRGFNVGDPDGMMGPKTKRAIMEFQRSAGIPITGKVDKRLLKALDLQT